MDMVLNICISDGLEIIVDGFDDISFYNEIPNIEVTHSGYSWQKDYYNELMNNLTRYKFIGIERNDSSHKMEYRTHSFAFKNTNFEGNKPLILQTNCITTIIDMYG
ncbi:hypothetical protein [Cytobacillus purgationiresistens]|uniref:Uncharacterized protein n=1 Tax=Cytobacillus purgationiresistens TaxID=863449 RepID=A0ABU0ACF4_9BACI|nr:hypothetical protein [Cytobacillus purgationiresistens]MDQ0268922.1 hypothetical protein [Cytobacillus purgationiresistens]